MTSTVVAPIVAPSVRYGTVAEVVGKLRTGDVFLCRGKSWLSNAIADVAKDRRYQSPDYWGWSHVAPVDAPGTTAATVITTESTQSGKPFHGVIGIQSLSLQVHLDEYTSSSNEDYGGILVACFLSDEVRAAANWAAWKALVTKDTGEPYSYLQMVLADLDKKMVDWHVPLLAYMDGKFAGADFHAAFCSQWWDMLGQAGGYLSKDRIPGICEPVDCWEAAIYAPEAIQLTGPALTETFGFNSVAP